LTETVWDVSEAVTGTFWLVDVVNVTASEFAGTDPFFTSETVIVSAPGEAGEVGVAETYRELNVHAAGINV